MRYFHLTLLWVLFSHPVGAQQELAVTGTVLNYRSKEPLTHVLVEIEESTFKAQTDHNGRFRCVIPNRGNYILKLSLTDFVTKRIVIDVEASDLDLGHIYMEEDIVEVQKENLITISDSELLEDGSSSNSSTLLRATRDVFLSRAAFDFGQAFFRVRGYDSQNGVVLVNGLPMNKMFDGRPQWNNWGGLNDVTRNQQFTNGLEASHFTFGGILGNTNIDTRPSLLRPGTRLSTSASNRTYSGRLMATYNSGLQDNQWAYCISGSRRWARQGYIDGTLYGAFSFFGAFEYHFNERSSINLTGIWASNRRGRSAAITNEVYELVGKKYNPYWGEQNGKIRNSRERKIAEPIIMVNHFYESNRFSLNTGMAYQFGTNTRSRLAYYNAPNPDPTYYRYLPSYYINSSIGANFISASEAKEAFKKNPQMDWQKIYMANTGPQAAYVLYDDISEDGQLTLNTVGNLVVRDDLQLDFGLGHKSLVSDNYAAIYDLLDADFHEDIDPFSNTSNDINGQVLKREGDIFNYHYTIDASQFDGFVQLRFERDDWNTFLSGRYASTTYQRDGQFLNERFLDSSFGKSKEVQFTNYALKGGLGYKLTGRHWFTANAAYLTRPPVLQQVFVNPRENNLVVPEIQSEAVSTVDLNYFIRLPKLTGRITGFYTRFQNITDINFFFVDAGVGSDFVQEVLTDLDKLHMGTEIGLEYQLSSAVKLTAVGAVGKYVFASHPNLAINFDTAGAEEDLINLDGFVDLGVADIKDYKLAQGPQKAFSFGVEYRDPKYWWVGATTNYLGNNYANISTLSRTPSFYLDPETGLPFSNATEANVKKLLEQHPLDDFYLLNLVGGKSWLRNGKYISVFVSINNLFDAEFRTGGYEQSRNGNFGQMQQDNISGTPSFAPKYWYGYGRTYFLNLAFSF